MTLYSRPGCHLCDAAREVVERVCADLGEEYVEVSIDDDPALVDRFGEEIPVTFVDGRQHDFWRVDETRLRGAPGHDPGRGERPRAACAFSHVLARGAGRRVVSVCSRVHKLLQ